MSKKESATSSCLHNVVSSGTTVTGNITAEEDLRVDGIVNGNVTCKGKVIIGPTSTVTGNIESLNVDLMGKIQGNISCSGNIVLRNMSQLTGDIETLTIEIEVGAIFSGNCSMKTSQSKKLTTV